MFGQDLMTSYEKTNSYAKKMMTSEKVCEKKSVRNQNAPEPALLHYFNRKFLVSRNVEILQGGFTAGLGKK